jgi:hypothetical protein
MTQPFRFTIICNETGKVSERNYPPTNTELERGNIKAYLDTRYDAKLRLYKYVMFKKYGVKL